MKSRQKSEADQAFRRWIPFVFGVIVILAILYFIIRNNNISDKQFNVLVLILSIAFACISMLFTGYLDVKHKVFTAGGAFAVAVISLLVFRKVLITNYNDNEPFDFKISLQDRLGSIPISNQRDGSILLKVNANSFKSSIDDKGFGIFEHIPSNWRDSSAALQLRVQGWQFEDDSLINTIELSKNGKTFIIERDNSQCCISGIIRDENGELIKNLHFVIGDSFSTTNEFGKFYVNFPRSMQKESYRLIIQNKAYQNWDTMVSPTGSEIGIVLSRKTH